MNLAEMAVRLRSRSAYEATDLGFAFARRFWWPICRAWLICVLPVAAIATAVAMWTGHLGLPLLAVWLLKPAYDRLPLFVVSRGIFGDVPSTGRTVRHTLSRWNSLTIFLDCTIRRCSPFRGFLQPLRELEHQSSRDYRNRKKALLRRDVKGPSLLLLGVCMAAEQLLVVSAFVLAFMLVPPEFQVRSMDSLQRAVTAGDLPAYFILLTMAAYFVALTAVEIFYVAGSFGLYINRRVHLEGWDVEIEFKRLARRLSETIGRAAGVLLVGAGLVGGLVASPDVASAQEREQMGSEAPAETRASTKDPKEVAEEIVSAPEFGEEKEKWVWVPEDEEESESDASASQDSTPMKLPGSLAALLEALVWLSATLLVLGAGYLIVRRAMETETGTTGEDSSDQPPEPTVESELEERDFRLPADLVETARRRWEEGAPVESLSVLYRGTIRGLAERYDIEVEPSMTARECHRIVRAAGGPGDYVGHLGRAWTSTVYAGRPPNDEEAERLFRHWRRHFTGGPS